VAETTTPTTATTTAEPTQATEAVNAVPASTGDIDPNAVNGAGRGVTTTQAEDTAVTATTTTGAVTSTGESLSHARILGVLTIFVSFMFLILIRRERKEGMYEGNKYI
jgi:cobalamin biosynthesis Mg chelatase CobN